MSIGAAVLAGGRTKGEMRRECGTEESALIELAGRPMAQYVVDALRATEAVDDIAIIAPPGTEAARREWPGARVAVSQGKEMIDSILAAAEAFRETPLILVAACDMPMITPEALAHFAEAALAADVDCCYSMVEDMVIEAKYPGAERTWVRLRDGRFSGGNVTALRPSFILGQREIIEQALALRKKPLRLAQLMGFGLVLGLLLGLVTSEQVARRGADILRCTVAVVKSPYPEIAMDVDKPSDLRLAREALEGVAN